MSRISARETLMKLVFEFNFINNTSEIEDLLEGETLNCEDKKYIQDNLEGIKTNYRDILDVIEKNHSATGRKSFVLHKSALF